MIYRLSFSAVVLALSAGMVQARDDVTLGMVL